MKTSLAQREAALRARFLELISPILKEEYSDILKAGSNVIALPCVDSEGNEKFLRITIQTPRKNRDGIEYDGYAEAQLYKEDCEAKELEKKIKLEAAAIEQKRKAAKA